MVLCIALFMIISGCGKTIEEASTSASGNVTLDGQPLTVGTINFYPEGEGDSCFATINEDGTFTVNTSAGTTGLEPGTYTAIINYNPEEKEDEDGNLIEVDNPIPAKYRNENEPNITVTVPESGTSDLTIELTSDE